MARRNRVRVELLKDVKDESTGDLLWTKGTQLLVDPMSAEHYIKNKVAQKVTEKQAEKADADAAKADEQPSVGGAS